MREYIEYITRYERGEDGTLIQRIGYGYEPIAEQIVRCRDCKQYTDEQDRCALNEPEGFYCKRFSYWDGDRDVTYYNYMEPAGFCAWGEMRSERVV